jgi:hypothetical protein
MAEFSNLSEELLEYFNDDITYSHHKNCSMFFSQLKIDTATINKRCDVDFLLSPCFLNNIPNLISSSYTISSKDINYNSRTLKTHLGKFYNLVKETFLHSGGFYGVCSFNKCPCGPEAVLNDVFWGKRNLTMLTKDSSLKDKILTKLRHNRMAIERIITEASKTISIDKDSFQDIIVQKNTFSWINLREKSIVMKTKISRRLEDCLKHIQSSKSDHLFAKLKHRFKLKDNEEDFIKFLLFQKAIKR